MAGIVLNVDVRERTGTGGARASRRDGFVPGVLYGGDKGPVAISLQEKEVVKAINAGKFLSHLVEIEHKGERQTVIPRDVQFHPVTEHPLHIDLYRVDEKSVIDVQVPLHFVNQEASPGLKRGGVLNVPRHMIELRVPASRIPERVDVDLTGLEIGQVLHVEDITLPEGVTTKLRRNFAIASLSGRMAEEAEPVAAAAAEGPAAADAAKAPAAGAKAPAAGAKPAGKSGA
jgi:large subunit ribosomal protein L25